MFNIVPKRRLGALPRRKSWSEKRLSTLCRGVSLWAPLHGRAAFRTSGCLMFFLSEGLNRRTSALDISVAKSGVYARYRRPVFVATHPRHRINRLFPTIRTIPIIAKNIFGDMRRTNKPKDCFPAAIHRRQCGRFLFQWPAWRRKIYPARI